MNDNAKKLVAALRSGKYQQTRGRLNIVKAGSRPVGLCCLGVACEIAIENGVPLHKELLSLDGEGGTEVSYYTHDKENGEAAVLPPIVQRWLGLQSHRGAYIDQFTGPQTLTNLNDQQRLTFAQIADVIESEPQGLFEYEPASTEPNPPPAN